MNRLAVFFLLATGACQQRTPEPHAIEAFTEWYERYSSASPNDRADLEEQGFWLAVDRRAQLYALIASDPAAVVAARHDFTDLPARISTQLERWVDGRGDLDVLGAHFIDEGLSDRLVDAHDEAGITEQGEAADAPAVHDHATHDHASHGDGEEAHSATFHYRHIATLAGTRYEAFVYGRRIPSVTMADTALHGIAIDDRIALSDSPIRMLSETDAHSMQAPLRIDTGCDAGALRYAHFGDSVRGACNPRIFEDADRALEDEFSQGVARAAVSTVGTKTLLYIIVDFSDKAATQTQATAQSTMDTQVNPYYAALSYGLTSFVTTVTPTLRLPQTAAAYATQDPTVLLKDARAAATAAGYPNTSYNWDVIAFPRISGWSWSGMGYVGGKGTWLNGSYSRNVTAHELGHNYGVHHANLWVATNGTIVGAGSSVEYGNPFDVMGQGSGHFGAWMKHRLAWLPASRINTLTTSGVYRIYDVEATSSDMQALKITKDATTHYWVEFKPNASTTNVAVQNGAVVSWGYTTNKQSQLLDTAPSTSTANDAPLVLGRTLSDTTTQLHITPIAKNATTPASLDVVVNLGAFAGNQAPTLTVSASASSATVNTAVVFTATATDPDGDALAYTWDFGDGTVSTNAATQTRSWTSSRWVPARVTVSDMKGQTRSATVLVRIGSPSTTWVGGRVLTDGSGTAGVRITAGSRSTTTDSDGTYVLTGVTSGSSYTVTAARTGFTFTPQNFTNPVRVSAGMALDFTGAAQP